MARDFMIPKQGFEGIQTLAVLGPQKLSISSNWLENRALTVSIGTLADDLAKHLQCSSQKLETAFRAVLIPLNDLRYQSGQTAQNVLRADGRDRRASKARVA